MSHLTDLLLYVQVLTAYKAELQEYRALQEELGPWTQAFQQQQGRKPGIKDVERTGTMIPLC